MEVEYVKEFLVLSSVLNYERSADILYISQSSLFKHIKALEADLGVTLFERNGKKISLSPAGKRFISYARQLENIDGQLRRALTKGNEGMLGNVRLYMELANIKLIMDFNRSHPEYKIDASYGQEGKDGCKLLAMDEVDVGILESPERLNDEFEILPFESRPLCVMVYEGHPFENRKLLELSELNEEEIVSFAWIPDTEDERVKLFKTTDFVPHVVMTATSDESIRRMVREHVGIALVFENVLEFNEQGLTLINLKTDISRNCYLCYRRNESNEAVLRFIEFAKKRIRWDGK